MKTLITYTLFCIFLFITYKVSACEDTNDCDYGSKCVKASPSADYGYCLGGSTPGNSHDRVPAYNPTDVWGTQGNTCSYDGECGFGHKCVKGGGFTSEGYCL